MTLRVKICGITNLEQGEAIAHLGATALGFILVPNSPRYIAPEQLMTIIPYLPATVESIGVFVDSSITEVVQIVAKTGLNAVQLHGQENVAYCRELRQQLSKNLSGDLPRVEILKALRIRNRQDLENIVNYETVVDTFLLDAYHPQLLGGTGHTLDWSMLADFIPNRPWFLAGGLNPENISIALRHLKPDGIDLSSGVEISPGNKDLRKVEKLFAQLSKV
jgi:phosphoribosylanthranilate isomerase